MSRAAAATTTTTATALTTLTSPTNELPTWSTLTRDMPPQAILTHAVQLRLITLERLCFKAECSSHEKGKHMRLVADDAYEDGWRFRCDTCKGDWCVRRGTVFGEHRGRHR